MGKRRFTEDSWRRDPWFQALVDALLHSRTPDDMGNFLRDVATLSELQAWGERLEVAKLLAQGLSYRDVAQRTGASTTTVTRVAKFIENGEGGYRKILKTHRHHRMKVDVKKQGVPPIGSDTSEKSIPVSPLQKYLQR